MKRTRILALCTAGVVAVGAGGFILGRQVKSPADAAAQAAPPTASRLAVPVERRVISATLITRGDVRFGDPKPVVLPPSALKANLGNLVTLAATKGQEIEPGQRVLEVAGRPVLALVGSTPAYRDLRPGDQGDDVRQLEDGLSKLGFGPGPVDGRYDDATERGVEAWYRSVGYEPFGPTETQRTQLQTLRDGTSRAADGERSAKRAYDNAATPAKSRVLQADESVRSAKEKAAAAPSDADDSARKADGLVAARQAALDQGNATRDQTAVGVRRAERERDDSSAVREAELAVDDAKAAVTDAEAAITQAERGVVEAQRSVDDARANLVDAQKSVDTAKENERRGSAVVCPTPSPCEVPDNSAQKEATRSAESRLRQANTAVESALSALASRTDSVEQARRARDRLVRAVTRAEAGREKAVDAGPDRAQAVVDAKAKLNQAESAVTQAERDLDDARKGVDSTRRQGSAGTRSADAALDVALAGRSELSSASELASLRAALDSAIDTKRRADTDLADLESKVGISVPANEIVFLPDLPRRVDEVKVGRGEPVNGAVISVTNARLAVDASVDAVDAPRLRPGATGEIEAEDLSLTLPVTITKIANRPGTDGADADKVRIELTIDEGATADGSAPFDPSTLNGVNVKVTLPIQSTGTSVLAVPVAAVSVAGDGSSRIEIEDDPAKQTRFVTVTPGLAAEGYVEITPVGGGRVREGDLVVVGTEGASDLTVTTDTTEETAESDTGPPSDTATPSETATPDGTEADAAADSAAPS